MPFALDGNPTPSEISDAINYILANLNAGVPAQSTAVSNNTSTGFIANAVGDLLSYQYRYIDIKFADNTSGLNFSDNPMGRLYFGIRNDNIASEDTNPADYTWFQVTGGFGAGKLLWILVQGGRHINYSIGNAAPDSNPLWMVAPTRSVDLDGAFVGYKQYMVIRFADDSIGTGFSASQTNKTYYGIYTSDDQSIPTDPTLYEWSPWNFGTTDEVYYRVYGGRNVSVEPATYPLLGYILYSIDNVNLDVLTLGAINDVAVVSEVPLIIQSPYRYMLLRYGTNSVGAGFSTNPTGKTYFGLQASDVLTTDNNPTDYTWFSAGGTFLVDVNLWTRSATGNNVQFSLTLQSPDISGWQDSTNQAASITPYIDVFSRSGNVVTDISSPSDGRLGYSTSFNNGVINLNLDPYGQGKNTGGFNINPATTASITVDQFGRVQQIGSIDQVRFSSMITYATAGQTVFTFSNNQADQILVFRNGLFLRPTTDYTRTTTNFTLTNACTLNDVVSAYYVRLIDATSSLDKVPFVVSVQTLTAGQTNVVTLYSDGSEILFLNGALIVDSDYTYIGNNQGYVLKTASTGGSLCVVSFSFNNQNALIFSENYTETVTGTTNVVFPTSFYRNSSLIWFNGVLLRPSADYTIPGAGVLSANYTLIGGLSYTGQPSQFCSFNSSGEASVSSLSSAGVKGMDMPVFIEHEPTMLEMFNGMKKEINKLKREVKLLKGKT